MGDILYRPDQTVFVFFEYQPNAFDFFVIRYDLEYVVVFALFCKAELDHSQMAFTVCTVRFEEIGKKVFFRLVIINLKYIEKFRAYIHTFRTHVIAENTDGTTLFRKKHHIPFTLFLPF